MVKLFNFESCLSRTVKDRSPTKLSDYCSLTDQSAVGRLHQRRRTFWIILHKSCTTKTTRQKETENVCVGTCAWAWMRGCLVLICTRVCFKPSLQPGTKQISSYDNARSKRLILEANQCVTSLAQRSPSFSSPYLFFFHCCTIAASEWKLWLWAEATSTIWQDFPGLSLKRLLFLSWQMQGIDPPSTKPITDCLDNSALFNDMLWCRMWRLGNTNWGLRNYRRLGDSRSGSSGQQPRVLVSMHAVTTTQTENSAVFNYCIHFYKYDHKPIRQISQMCICCRNITWLHSVRRSHDLMAFQILNWGLFQQTDKAEQVRCKY